MTRNDAALFARQELNKHNLEAWGVRISSNPDTRYLGLCLHHDKCIILNAEGIDIHPDPEIKNRVRHEIAHALVGPGHGHDEVWQAKAREVGCDHIAACSSMSLDPVVIDAIRSGATVEVTFEEQVIRTPHYHVTRLQDKCPTCGKVAKTASEGQFTPLGGDPDDKPDIKWTALECGHIICKVIPKGTPFHRYQAFGDESCQHVWNKNTCVKCDRKRLYPFQIEGARAAERALAAGSGFGFFDDMGVGKTNQASATVFFHPELCSPCLWIVKASLTWQTAMHVMNWDDQLPQIITNSKTGCIKGRKHYIISYDMLVPKVKQMKSGKTVVSGYDIKEFDKVGIKCVILDECQMIKNAGASRTQMVRRVVKGRKVIALSGTPWKNRGSELFPVLNMLDPMKFYSEEKFKRDWVSYYFDGRYRKEGGIRNIARFKELIKDIVIRRERSEVLPELPPVTRTKLYVKMTPSEESEYDEAVEAFVNWYESEAAEASGMHILAMMAKMRHLAAVAKIPATMDYVDEFVENTDRKLVIFLHHIDVGEMIYSDLKRDYGSEMPVVQIVGGMDPRKRNELIDLFNSSKRCLMVASTLSSGEGLNLQTGTDCLLHERQWNPANEEQVECRFIRIGQTASVVNAVYAHLDGVTTIDPKLDQINERKRAQYHVAMNKGEMPVWNQDSMMKELAELIVKAHKAKKRAA